MPVAAPGPSRRHSKLAPASELKVKVGSSSRVRPVGPELIVVSGGAVSTVKLRVAGARVGVGGRVDRSDLEGVVAVVEVGVGPSAGAAGGERAGRGAGAVEAAFEARPGLGVEAEARIVVGGRAARGRS